jgi:hypothetical protein
MSSKDFFFGVINMVEIKMNFTITGGEVIKGEQVKPLDPNVYKPQQTDLLREIFEAPESKTQNPHEEKFDQIEFLKSRLDVTFKDQRKS